MMISDSETLLGRFGIGIQTLEAFWRSPSETAEAAIVARGAMMHKTLLAYAKET